MNKSCCWISWGNLRINHWYFLLPYKMTIMDLYIILLNVLFLCTKFKLSWSEQRTLSWLIHIFVFFSFLKSVKLVRTKGNFRCCNLYLLASVDICVPAVLLLCSVFFFLFFPLSYIQNFVELANNYLCTLLVCFPVFTSFCDWSFVCRKYTPLNSLEIQNLGKESQRTRTMP